jgi:hypothetical protein
MKHAKSCMLYTRETVSWSLIMSLLRCVHFVAMCCLPLPLYGGLRLYAIQQPLPGELCLFMILLT